MFFCESRVVSSLNLVLFRNNRVATLALASIALAFVLDLSLGCAKFVCFFYKFIFQCLMAVLKEKAVVKIGME